MERSEFIKQNKPLLEKLLKLLKKDYQYASVLAVDSFSKNFSVSKGGVSVGEQSLFTKKGFVVRVYKDGKYGEYSFNDIDESKVESIAAEITSTLSALSMAASSDFIDLYEEKESKFFKEVDAVAPEELKDEYIL